MGSVAIFCAYLENEELIKKQLNSKIPEVIKRALTAKEYVERLL